MKMRLGAEVAPGEERDKAEKKTTHWDSNQQRSVQEQLFYIHVTHQ